MPPKAQNTKARSRSVPVPNRRPSLEPDLFAASPQVMACEGRSSSAGVPTGEKTNWSSEVCELLDACDESDESDEMHLCMACRGAGSGSPREGLNLSIWVAV